MIAPIIIRCDGPNCSQIKGETNHWFVVNVGSFATTFYAIPWSKAGEAEQGQGKHACSQSCAAKLFSQWMSSAEKL